MDVGAKRKKGLNLPSIGKEEVRGGKNNLKSELEAGSLRQLHQWREKKGKTLASPK